MNPVEQVHVHAVLPTFDVTDAAWLVQSAAADVHWAHVGYVMYPTLQVLHVGPVNPVEQVHVHAVLPLFDVTDAAWLVQCVAILHWVHVG